MMMLENGMVVEAEKYDYMCKPDHWADDRDGDLLQDFCDEDMAVEIVKEWLDVEECDEDRALVVFEMFPAHKQEELIEEHIERHELQKEFNEWYENRYADYLAEMRDGGRYDE